MARSVKKGPFIDDHLMKKITKLNSETKKTVQDLVQKKYNFSGYGWSYRNGA